MSEVAETLGIRPSTERYLVAIYILEKEGGPVLQARVADRLGHTPPTVSETVRRLKDAGYVTSQGRTLALSPAGREAAESVLRKHCLAARLLADVVGVPWHLVHDEAERWEHVITDEVAVRLAEVLGNPTTCPHGCPIPGLCTEPVPTSALSDAKVGQRVQLVRLLDPTSFSPGSLAYLEDNGFLPGAEALVEAEGPDGALVLRVGDRDLVMGAPMAAQLRVVALT